MTIFNNELDIALLVLALLAPFILYFTNRLVCKSHFSAGMVAMLSILAVYSCLVLSAHFEETRLETALATFDLNKNGSLEGNELTVQADEAMQRISNDTGRVFAPISGAIIAPLYVLVLSVLLYLVRRLTAKTRQFTSNDI